MTTTKTFDLPGFMFSHFNRVDFGGDLFSQSPAGIRFDIGFEHVYRAVELFHFAIPAEHACIVAAQDWTLDGTLHKRYTPLFEMKGIFRPETYSLQSTQVFPIEETPYRLTWTCLSAQDINAQDLFQGIANREQDGAPKISSGVYLIDPQAKVIVHMYDDRGLDVIAAERKTLRPMFERYSGWFVEHWRGKIEVRFKRIPDLEED